MAQANCKSLVYHFVANFILFLRVWAFFMSLPVEGAIAPASTPYQRTEIHILGSWRVKHIWSIFGALLATKIQGDKVIKILFCNRRNNLCWFAILVQNSLKRQFLSRFIIFHTFFHTFSYHIRYSAYRAFFMLSVKAFTARRDRCDKMGVELCLWKHTYIIRLEMNGQPALRWPENQ